MLYLIILFAVFSNILFWLASRSSEKGWAHVDAMPKTTLQELDACQTAIDAVHTAFMKRWWAGVVCLTMAFVSIVVYFVI